MRIVEHEPGVVRPAHGHKLRERCDVTVHAEHAVARHQRPAGFPETSFQGGGVAVRISRKPGAARQARVDQRGVIQPVLEHAVAAPDKRADHGEVGHVAGGEEQRARPAGELRQRFLEEPVLAAMAAHQVRRSTANPPLPRRPDTGLGHPRMIGQP